MAEGYRLDWDAGLAEEAADAGGLVGLQLAAEHLLGVSRDLVPIEEGTLERSGVASVDPDDLTAAVSYDTVYAVRQHEELTWRHDPGRQAKYLEEPAGTEAPVMAAIVARAIADGLQ